MALFVRLKERELKDFLARYPDIGELVKYEGIYQGVTNTNYFVDTTQGRFVLTLIELGSTEDMEFSCRLCLFLHAQGLSSPRPMIASDGSSMQSFQGRPTVLVERIEGHHIQSPDLKHCAAAGIWLGRMHKVASAAGVERANPRGYPWFFEVGERLLRGHLDDETAALCRFELAEIKQNLSLELPQGIVHADFFVDNALFNDSEGIAGIIDFYYACKDALLLDVAIAVNDWCTTDDGGLDAARAAAFLSSYHSQRPFTDNERKLWPHMLRVAAMRFWLSRLLDMHFPPAPEEVVPMKDPREFERILRSWRARPPVLDDFLAALPENISKKRSG